jgi:hydrogenase maturation protease
VSGTLVGGIGNIFLGDDGFGVEVVRRLAEKPARADVHIADFGIRSLDLAYALLDDYHDVILVDAMPRGEPPGTLYVIEPSREGAAVEGPTPGLAAHGFVPAQVLALVAELGSRKTTRVRIVGCEPAVIPADGDVQVGLSAPVAAAVERAVDLVEELVGERPSHA